MKATSTAAVCAGYETFNNTARNTPFFYVFSFWFFLEFFPE